mgnify:CR=1 FL=1
MKISIPEGSEEEQAKYLAEKFGGDTEKAYTAGLVHDIMKNQPVSKMLELIESDGQTLTDSEKAITVTLHGSPVLA